jgi:hypothetical protein
MLYCSILLHCIDITLRFLLCRLYGTSVTIHSFFFIDTKYFGLAGHLQVYRLPGVYSEHQIPNHKDLYT